jgi:hypothetical protein
MNTLSGQTGDKADKSDKDHCIEQVLFHKKAYYGLSLG